ncbi:acyl-CoA thioesterase [Paenibacillus melissococcoides]|uniref:Acyl-CoA thioesterase n=1 Tax=Paenibacillus melissococcoides TaxID=2912268 RepID=A0ABN8UEQ1_9BACL|nr:MULTISPECIES: acyl-CoA thioesterase [Paenibacillus]MEB9892479.1 acyl-CoA thioesterase [Bacillus cereus]CAH8248279.1 acyl-CoA thioesterase [Paenibacillus melissococcoides]CAH8717957.1 acyl-CoA thioesterase [Paenibacillus melissococcoides]CAH8719165.1 acyl-CoA thioesterase [Paenibacillus melissococcoides]GIO78641.1 acyl-CoA thioester hydrolase [Paenibacillus dendritiformis]
MNPVRVEIKVRFGECDFMGVAHHSHYFHWFELGRFELLQNSAIGEYIKTNGFYFPVIDIGCKYRKGAVFNDIVIVETYLRTKSKAYLEFDHKLFRKKGRVLLAEGFSKHVLTTADGQMLYRLPEKLLDMVSLLCEEGVS